MTTQQMMGAEAISGLTSNVETVFTSEQIDAILPHRYPLALVDKVVEYEEGKRAVGIKSVTKVSVMLCVVRLGRGIILGYAIANRLLPKMMRMLTFIF